MKQIVPYMNPLFPRSSPSLQSSYVIRGYLLLLLTALPYLAGDNTWRGYITDICVEGFLRMREIYKETMAFKSPFVFFWVSFALHLFSYNNISPSQKQKEEEKKKTLILPWYVHNDSRPEPI